MSFQNLQGPRGGGHSQPSQRPAPRADDDSSHERDIKASIQKMQEATRECCEHLGRIERGFASKRVREGIDKSLQHCRDLAQETETLFQDWTVHLAGEPAKKHRKRFSMEKLQKAFEDEVGQLKDLARRAVAAQPEFSDRGGGARGASELGPIAAEQTGGGDGGGSWASQTTMMQEAAHHASQIANEREEGIKRIHTQVCEVNQIMQDMASIVVDQGAQLDSIESQAETASQATQDATRELRKASDRQRSSREQMLCLLAAAVVVFFFVIMPHLHSSPPTILNAPPPDPIV